jgi:hypothetical protein
LKGGTQVKWSIWPWNRCAAVLEKKGDSPYYGRCDRPRKHQGWHALERGFDVVWFETKVIDLKQEWEPIKTYAKSDVESTEEMRRKLWCTSDEERPPPANEQYHTRKEDDRDAWWLTLYGNEAA